MEEIQNRQVDRQKTVSWQALEHAYYTKTSDWYWIVGTVGVTAAILSAIFGSFVFALLLIIATLTILIHGARVPGVIKVELQERGVRVGNVFYPYKTLKAFSLSEESDPPILVLDSKAFLNPDVRIFIEEVSPHAVRDYLLDHLDEKYHEPSLVDGLIHYLGF